MSDIEFSRHEGVIHRIAHRAADAGRFQHKIIRLTGDASSLGTLNGRYCLLDALRLLVRICRNVQVVIPSSLGALHDEARGLARRIEFSQPVIFHAEEDQTAPPDWTLHVGPSSRYLPRTTQFLADGWLARVANGPTPLASECHQANPITCLFAACMGVTETFKGLIGIDPSKAPLVESLTFNLWNREVGDVHTGPPLPTDLSIQRTWLVGLGAIGNGIALLIDQLSPSGEIVIVDPQSYGPENLGTCVLIGPDDVNEQKTSVVKGLLSKNSRLRVVPYEQKIEELKLRVGEGLSAPDTIFAALDDIEPRVITQTLWPNLLIDAAIGDFTIQSATHRWGSDLVCMRCLFKIPDRNPAEIASERTGLSIAKAARLDDVVTEEDVIAAHDSDKDFLRSKVGRKVCSVIAESKARAIGGLGFSPSAPYVACASACLSAVTWVQDQLGYRKSIASRFSCDLLIGPLSADEIAEKADPRCECQTRKSAITRWREGVRTASAIDS